MSVDGQEDSQKDRGILTPRSAQEHPWKRWIPPVFLGALIVVMAPFWGSFALPQLRDRLGKSGLAALLTVVVLVAGVSLCLYAWRRIRHHRARRYGLLATALTLVVLHAVTTGRDEAAVERVHFVLYGAVAMLFVRAFQPSGGKSTLLLAMFCAATVGLADEFVQWLVPVRVGDIFDVVGLNLYASFCGALAGIALFPPSGQETQGATARGSVGSLLVWSSVFIVATAAFLQAAHLGYEISDPEIGTFRSFFPKDRLQALDQERARQWNTRSPGPLRATEIEDYFRTEAGWHVLARNRARQSGELRVAWYEERILERYYSSFLDLQTRRGDYQYRLPPDEKQALIERFDQKTSDGAAPYESTADNGRIWIRPRPAVLWLGVALWVLVAAILRSRLDSHTRRDSSRADQYQ